MSPLQFEQAHAAGWAELEAWLDQAEDVGATGGLGRRLLPGRRGLPQVAWPAQRLAERYRQSCEHLALARARAYPRPIVLRLEGLTQRAHALIYAQPDIGLDRLLRLAGEDFPRQVRAHAAYVGVALALFLLPLLAMGLACWREPGFILHLMDGMQLRPLEEAYAQGWDGRKTREGGDDWMMFGNYIRNNIGIAFQMFAGGLFFGLGSTFFLVYNGVFIGGVAGYMLARELGANFFPFVITHGAFELTAIVLAGAAGLRLGHVLIAPGRLTRRQALVQAASATVVLIYGITAMLAVAAVIEAFWSSSAWIPSAVKYGVGTAAWIFVLAYLGLRGRSP